MVPQSKRRLTATWEIKGQMSAIRNIKQRAFSSEFPKFKDLQQARKRENAHTCRNPT